jgi:branched-chain amino acid transport system permease protein
VIAFLNAAITGIGTGSLYALVALGLNIVYATTRVFNFAHGSMVMAGAMGGVVLWQSFHLGVITAFALSVTGIVIIGGLTERLAVRSSLRRGVDDSLGWLLSTLGVSIIITSAFSVAILRNPGSTGTRAFPPFLPVSLAWHVGGLLIQSASLFVFVVMLVAAALLVVFLRWTHYGRALGAVADDREGAVLRGIPVARLGVLSFVIGAGLAAIAGFVAGPITQASLSVGLPLTLSGFIAATIGGIPTIEGAVVGGLILGLVEQMAAQYTNGSDVDVFTLVLLLLVLSLRPAGIFGKKVRAV